MRNDQLLMGVVLTLISVWAWFRVEWFVRETPKGQALTERFSESTARWIFRTLFLTGTLLGIGLTTNLLRPVQW